MSERQGIEIDYCPVCRGVWLDRGELDKIVERSVTADAVMPEPGMSQRSQSRGSDEVGHGHSGGRGVRGGRRRSWLGELFD